MSTIVYVLGFIVLIAGLAWAATILGVPSMWVTVGVVVVAGIAIIGIAGNLQTKETTTPPPQAQQPPAQPQQQPPAQPQQPREPREPREPPA